MCLCYGGVCWWLLCVVICDVWCDCVYMTDCGVMVVGVCVFV